MNSGWLFYEPRVPAHALARLTDGLHFPYRRLILHVPGYGSSTKRVRGRPLLARSRRWDRANL